MGVQSQWNHSAWFDYYLNRYYIAESGNDPSTIPVQGIGNADQQITEFASSVYLQLINPTPWDTEGAASSIPGVQIGKVAVIPNLEPR